MIREDSIQIPFAYTAGPGASRFLAALRDAGQILGAPCPVCRRVLCPARSFCPRCGEQTGEFVPVGPAGTVVSFTEQTLSDHHRDGGLLFGLVRLDGADTALLHRLLGHRVQWASGMRVRARFAPERRGHITDIEGFEPLGEQGSDA